MTDFNRDDDFRLMEAYQGVSAEFVRLALLGIGAVGFLYTLDSGSTSAAGLSALGPTVCFIIALLLLGVSAATGVLHRYFSTDSMTHFITADRAAAKQPPDTETANREKNARDDDFNWSGRMIATSAVTLALGSFMLGFGFILVLLDVICRRSDSTGS